MAHSDQLLSSRILSLRSSHVGLFAFRLAIVGVVVAVLVGVWKWKSAKRSALHLVVGGSMAETFYGSHFQIECGDCGFVFACDQSDPPADMQAVCPNCGFRLNTLRAELIRAGDRVSVDRSSYGKRSPRRWEIVALRESRVASNGDDSHRAAVKRIVGLPGEHVAIRHGDLYIDGRLERKTLAQQRQMAILVYDDRFRPAQQESLPDRWRAVRRESQWRRTSTGYRFQSDRRGSKSALDFLTYYHWRCMPVLRGVARTDSVPIRDNYAYNQGISRQLYDISDLLLMCRVRLTGRGRIVLSVHDGYDEFQATLSTYTNTIEVTQGESLLARTQWRSGLADRELLLEYSLIDRQSILAIDGQVVMHSLFEPRHPSFQPRPSPVRIGAADLTAEVVALRIYRDIYYYDPGGTRVDWKLGSRLGSDEFFVLGDNVPISVDSRKWPHAGVSRKMLLGQVLDRSHRTSAWAATPDR